MSRVVYSDQTASSEQEALRSAHGVRLVSGAEEGTGVNALPAGTYGFTYSPGLPNAPLFAVRRYRSYETHKLPTGETYLIGFATPKAATDIASSEEVTVLLHPEPEGDSMVLVRIPYRSIRRHRGYAAPNEHGFQLTVSGV
jgi:hypothetical protein